MKILLTLGAATLLGIGLLVSRGLSFQDPGQYVGQDLAAMRQMGMPGPEHALLARRAGEWEQTLSIAMMPGQPPVTTQGHATSKMILGGRFLEVTSTAEMMGSSVESRHIFGFDRRHQLWTVLALDTMGTYWVSGAGKQDPDGMLRMHGEDDDPTGKQAYYFELEVKSDNEYYSRVFFTQLGPVKFDPPFKMLEVHAVRAKKN